MTQKASSAGKGKKLKLNKETLKDLEAKDEDVKGGGYGIGGIAAPKPQNGTYSPSVCLACEDS